MGDEPLPGTEKFVKRAVEFDEFESATATLSTVIYSQVDISFKRNERSFLFGGYRTQGGMAQMSAIRSMSRIT